MSNQEPLRRSSRTRNRNPVLDVDLNIVPPCENQNQEGTSNLNSFRDRQTVQEEHRTLPAPIDLEAIDDDDVIISSPRAFAEAKNNSRRNRGRTVVVDVDNEERPARNKRRRTPTDHTNVNSVLLINLDSSSNSVRNSGKGIIMSAPPASPPKEPTFSCPVCIGPLVEEVSTKCGHIFCRGCIKTAIAAQGKCPTCRRKITMKDTRRIYLPAAGSS